MRAYGPRALDQVPQAAIDRLLEAEGRNGDLGRELYDLFQTSGLKAAAFLSPAMVEAVPFSAPPGSGYRIAPSNYRSGRLAERLESIQSLNHPRLSEVTVVVYSNRPVDFLNSLTIARRCPWRTVYTVDVDQATYEAARGHVTDRVTILRGSAIMDRLDQAMRAVETPFVFWMGDDDLVNPRFLVTAAETLSKSPRTGSVIGLGRNVMATTTDDPEAAVVVRFNDLGVSTLANLDPLERLREASVWGGTFFHNLMRTDMARSATRAGRRTSVPEPFFEIVMDVAIALSGTVEHLPVLSIVRLRTPSSGATVNPSFLEYAFDRGDAPLHAVRGTVSDLIKDLGLELPRDEVTRCLAQYVTKSFMSRRLSSPAWNQPVSVRLIKQFAQRSGSTLGTSDAFVFETLMMAFVAMQKGEIADGLGEGHAHASHG